jgi:hypothetical protein
MFVSKFTWDVCVVFSTKLLFEFKEAFTQGYFMPAVPTANFYE